MEFEVIEPGTKRAAEIAVGKGNPTQPPLPEAKGAFIYPPSPEPRVVSCPPTPQPET